MNIEDIYPLSPMQEGMLFHARYDDKSWVYFDQIHFTLCGNLDLPAFERAWQLVVDRHQILRAGFEWEGLEQPLQVIRKDAKLPFRVEDWSGLPPEDHKKRLESYLKADRTQGFKFDQPPLMRVAVICLADDEHHVIWSFHHILLDGWSLPLILRELFTCYEAFCRCEQPALAYARPYADYIGWLQGQNRSAAEAYWRRTLGGLTAPTVLPIERGSAAGLEVADSYGVSEQRLSPEATARLQAVARRYQVTMNTVVQGAWAVLLGRYSGQGEVVFGTTVSGRPAELEGVEGMVGMFINTLPVRVKVDEEREVGEWLVGLQSEQVEMRQYEYSSLVEVQGWSDVPRGLPLFETVIVFENYPIEVPSGKQAEGLRITSFKTFEKVNTPLSLVLGPGKSLMLRSYYDRTRYDDETIRRLIDHFMTLLEGIATSPEQKIAELPLLPEAERRLLLEEWNDQNEYPQDQLLHKLFEAQAEKDPSAVAVSFEGAQVSYGELNALSNQIAHGLKGASVDSQRVVAVLLETSPLQIAALMGILKAGCAFVCLDSNYPASRLQQVLNEVNPSCLLSESDSLLPYRELLAQLQEETGCSIVNLDLEDRRGQDVEGIELLSGAKWFELSPKTNPDIVVESNALAYVVYTSGSAGKPKGILQSHRSFAQFLTWQSNYFEMVAPKRIAQWASIIYDASYCEIFGALCFGATLCGTNVLTRTDPLALVRWAIDEKISLLQVVPSFCRQMLQVLETDYRGVRKPLPHLERMLLAGEVLPVDLARAWLERFEGGAQLFNLYGPSEAVLATYYPVETVSLDQRSIPVGYGIDGRQILILDEKGRLCPIGLSGEIHIRSQFLTDGYSQRAEETAQRYIQSPLHNEYPDRVYRTGDVGRWLPDGTLEFLGRKDNQVKIRGMRVELEEIESILCEHESVSESAVVAHDDEGDQRLTAFVVRKPHSEATSTEAADSRLEAQHIAQYQKIYDEVYSQNQKYADFAGGLNLRIWVSSYTGQSLIKEEIVESVDDVVRRILSLKPGRVLDLGCGSGLVLSRIAPHCEAYVGTDISEEALQYLRKHLLDREGLPAEVTLLLRGAHEFNGFEENSFDTVIINDVHIYFPGIEYFVRVLEGAVKVTKPGGAIYIGGIRSLPLLKAFHTSVQLHKSSAALTKEQLQSRVQSQMHGDKELVIDPAFFAALKLYLPKLTHLEILLKRGQYLNEVTLFQYDVILRVGAEGELIIPSDVRQLRWLNEELTLPALRDLLERGDDESLMLRNVSNARLSAVIKAGELLESEVGGKTVGEIRRALEEAPNSSGIDPEVLWRLGDELPYDVKVYWLDSSGDGSFDVLFTKRHKHERLVVIEPPIPERVEPWTHYANDPMKAKLEAGLEPRLRIYLRDRLPEHMIPSAFVFLEALPRTLTNKIDRKVLSRMNNRLPDSGADYVAPRTELETLIAGVWQELLKIDRIGIQDSFFDLGGHSLLATQVINRLREILPVELPLRHFFEAPTVAGLAVTIGKLQEKVREEIEERAQLVKRIKYLSHDEVRALLDEKALQL